MTNPTHIHRKGTRTVKHSLAVAPTSYRPGYFTELIRAHGFPPRFEPAYDYVTSSNQHTASEIGRRAGLAQRQDAPVILAGSRTEGRLKFLATTKRLAISKGQV